MLRKLSIFLILVSFLLMSGCKISGTVTEDGAGLEGASVDINESVSTTDEDGNYTSLDIFPMQYTITPSKAGYTFEPESQTVTIIDFISGNTTSVDFVAIEEGECAGGDIGVCYTGPLATRGVGACIGEVTPDDNEICDSLDNNCDGNIDEVLGDCSNGDTRLSICGIGACTSTGVETCINCIWTSTFTCTPGAPSTEICDNIDNDCNGTIDDGICCGCEPGETRLTICGIGACAIMGFETCSIDCAWSNDCTPGTPIAEICGDGIGRSYEKSGGLL